MTPEETDLARLLVALPGWRWVPGMKLAEKRIFIVWAGPDHLSCANDMFVGDLRRREGAWEARTSPHREWGPATLTEALPDLEHAGTAGALLEMLWAADPDAGWHVHGRIPSGPPSSAPARPGSTRWRPRPRLGRIGGWADDPCPCGEPHPQHPFTGGPHGS